MSNQGSIFDFPDFWDMGAFVRSLEVYPGHVVGHIGPTLKNILHTISLAITLLLLLSKG